MCEDERNANAPGESCSDFRRTLAGMSRRSFLSGVGGGAALGGLAMSTAVCGRSPELLAPTTLPPGATLRVKPLLIYAIPTRQEKTSWRWYGGIQTMEDVSQEAARLQRDLQDLASNSDFPLEFLPLDSVNEVASAEQVASHADCDVLLMFGACGYGGEVPHAIAAAGKPAVLFLRHRTEPHYCQHVSTHAIFLRHWSDSFQEPNMDVHDVAIDDYNEILWRLRALYGLKNAKGTKMLAIGGVMHYSPDGNKHGQQHAQEVWGYEIETVELAEFAERLLRTGGRARPAGSGWPGGAVAGRAQCDAADRTKISRRFLPGPEGLSGSVARALGLELRIRPVHGKACDWHARHSPLSRPGFGQ